VRGIGHYSTLFQPREGPLRARDDPRRDNVSVVDQQHRVRIVEVVGCVGTVQTVGEQLDLARSIGLEFHAEPTGDWQAGAQRLRDMNAHEPVDGGNVVLPAAPDHSVALAHQEPVADLQRCAGDCLTRRAIEHPHGQPVAPVRHFQQ